MKGSHQGGQDQNQVRGQGQVQDQTREGPGPGPGPGHEPTHRVATAPMPLMLGITGGNVAIVHQRLVVLGIEVPSVERHEDHFGPGTEAAIRRFQAETGLPITGVVDEATARALGLAGVQPRSIQGIVCRPDGTPLEGIAVRLYQQGLRGETVAGETRSGSDGSFSLPWPDGITAGLTVRADGGAGKAVSSTGVSAAGGSLGPPQRGR